MGGFYGHKTHRRMRVQSLSLDISGIQEGFLDPVDIYAAV